MNRRAADAGFPWVLACLAPVLAVMLYWQTLSQPQQTLDYETVSVTKDAARSLRFDTIWLAALPADSPDLGAYRPAEALALRIEYGLWPGNLKKMRAVNIALFVLFTFGCIALASRLLSSAAGRWAAGLIAVAHPMATEAVCLVSAQGVLIAAAAIVLALWLYRLVREGALKLWIAAPLIAVLAFIAAGAHEAGFILPFGLLVIELTGGFPVAEIGGQEVNPKRRKKGGDPEVEAKAEVEPEPAAPISSFLSRCIFIFVPIGLVLVVLLGLRLHVLGRIGAADVAAVLPGSGFGGRIITGISLIGLALIRLALPFFHSIFYPVRYESVFPVWASIPVLLGFLGLLVWSLKRRSMAAVGLLLMAAGLISAKQIFPMSVAFSERMLLFALPGFAIALGALFEAFALRGEKAEDSTTLSVPTFVAAIAFGALLGGFAFMRTAAWGNSDALLEREAKAHPAAPQPLVHQVIQLVSRPDPKAGYKVDLIREKSEAALALAKPPDADQIFQYLLILHIQRNNPEDAKKVMERALAAPGPHRAGHLANLATGALRMNLTDEAERAARAELERDPKNFRALYALSDVLMRRKSWDEAAATAASAAGNAPSPLAGVAFLRLGRILKQSNLAESDRFLLPARAFISARKNEPTLYDVYLELANLYIDFNKYNEAEQTLNIARSSVRLPSYIELYKLQVRTFEKRGMKTKIIDFLNQAISLNPYDIELKVYAARYFADNGMLMDAKPLVTEARARGLVGPDIFYVVGRIALEIEKNIPVAVTALRTAVKMDPQDKAAQDLLKQAEAKLAQMPAATPAPTPAP